MDVLEVPAGELLDHRVDAAHQLGLDVAGHHRVEPLHGIPRVAGPADVTGDEERARDLLRGRTGLGGHPQDERDPHRVDDVVRHDGGDDLAAQRMVREQVPEALDDERREVLRERRDQVRVVGERRLEHLLAQQALGVRQEHAQLGPGHSVPRGDALGHELARRQRLELPFEQVPRLELDHQVLERLHAPRGDRGLLAQDLDLEVVVVEDEPDHVVGNLIQNLISALERQLAALDRDREQDLQVDLVVRAVDARRVVDRVGVDPPAAVCVLDPAALGEAQVPALADDRGAQVAAVDAKGIVRPVVDLRVRLGRRLDVGADPAVPEQVDRRLEDRPDQVKRRELRAVDARAPPAPGARPGSTSPSAATRRRPRR